MTKKLIHKTLNNGLNIYLAPNSTNHSVTLDFIVKYGGFYSDFNVEGKKYHLNDGMAHLLEHLMCEKNSQGSFWELFGAKQMRTNACTWPWLTEFFVETVENVDYALETLIKGLSIPVFSLKDIEVTKPPIYQEIKMRQDQLSRQVLYTSTKNIFQNYIYISGLGTKENVENFTYEQIKLCYETFYQPCNEILFISGNFDPQKVLKKIEEKNKELKFNPQNFQLIEIEEPKEVANNYEVINMITKKDYVDICYKVDVKKYTQAERRMFSFYLGLFLKLNFSKISPIYKKLINQKIIEDFISTNFDFYQDYLIINAGCYTNNEKEFVKNIKNVFEQDRYLSPEIFNLALKKIKISEICSDPTSFGTSREFFENVLYYDYPNFDTIEELNELNYSQYIEFINSLEFKNYTITKVTN